MTAVAPEEIVPTPDPVAAAVTREEFDTLVKAVAAMNHTLSGLGEWMNEVQRRVERLEPERDPQPQNKTAAP